MKRLVSAFIAMLCLSACAPRVERVTESAFVLDTYAEVTVYAPTRGEASELAKAALEIVAQSELIFSRTHHSSELYALNAAGGGEVSDTLLDVITMSLEFAELSGGLFDPTVGALVELWDFKAENPAPPSAAEITEALSRVGYGRVVMSESYVALGGATLDLGAIAKGYAADMAAALLAENGAAGMINLGGDIVLTGEKPDGAWRIGVRNPIGEEDTYIDTLSMYGGAVATSGTYERGFDYGGVRYHHILDPPTGYPSRSGTASATVTAGSAARADALSTICLIMNADDVSELIRSMDGVSVLLVSDSGEVVR